MDKINFQDGTKVSSAKVTIDEVDYTVTPARYSGATPLSSTIMNAMQTNIENAINQNADNIGGQDYDNTQTYEVGDIVKYEEQLYICIENVDTPEEFDDEKWNQTDVLSSAGGNEIAIGDEDTVTGKTKLWIEGDSIDGMFSEVVITDEKNTVIVNDTYVSAINTCTCAKSDKIVQYFIDLTLNATTGAVNYQNLISGLANKPRFTQNAFIFIAKGTQEMTDIPAWIQENLQGNIYIKCNKAITSGYRLIINLMYFTN